MHVLSFFALYNVPMPLFENFIFQFILTRAMPMVRSRMGWFFHFPSMGAFP
jgi:hypothetical protein